MENIEEIEQNCEECEIWQAKGTMPQCVECLKSSSWD